MHSVGVAQNLKAGLPYNKDDITARASPSSTSAIARSSSGGSSSSTCILQSARPFSPQTDMPAELRIQMQKVDYSSPWWDIATNKINLQNLDAIRTYEDEQTAHKPGNDGVIGDYCTESCLRIKAKVQMQVEVPCIKERQDVRDEMVVLPSIGSCISSLGDCRREGHLLSARLLHKRLCNEGLDTDMIVSNHMVPMLIECGGVAFGHQVFNKLVCPNEHSWSSLISAYAESAQAHHSFDLYEKMQENGIEPSCYTLVALLKACSKLKDLVKGRGIHFEIRQRQFERELFVSNSLIYMFTQCGALSEAHTVCEELIVRDVISWTTLLAGYAEQELGQQALKCFQQMQSEGILPNGITFACVLKACGSIGALQNGQEMHKEVVEKGFDWELSVSNSLISMYCSCGVLQDAEEVFDKVSIRDTVSWNALISGYAEHGTGQEVLACFEEMQFEDLCPDNITLAYVLKACINMGDIVKGQEIHMVAAQKGVDANLTISNTLIGMYSRCGSLLQAREVFDKLKARDVVSWTALIAGYVEHGAGLEAMKAFDEMQEEGLSPNTVTFACALKACSITGAVGKGQELLTEITQKGYIADVLVGNSVVSLYANCGLFLEANKIFEKLPVRDVVTWTALIAGYVERDLCSEALQCYEQMQLEDVIPNSITFACLIKACGSAGLLKKAQEIHKRVVTDGFEQDPRVGNSLVLMYANCGCLAEAECVFEELPVPDDVAWSSMIKAYGMNHKGRNALQCYEDMQRQGVKTDNITFTCLLAALSHSSLVVEGQQLFKQITEEGIFPTVENYTSMIDILARSGHLHEAERFLEMMCPPSEDTWAALLSGCKTHGDTELGQRCFQQLIVTDPVDAAWYVIMSDIFAGAGRWDDASFLEMLRQLVKAKKKPASVLIEVNDKLHEFVVGSKPSEEVVAMLERLNLSIKEEGHIPNLSLVVRRISDKERETALCEHAEKMAIAFGLLHSSEGATLRLTKNLRMCNDCHNASKIISRVERREIILRDDCCIHRFKDGSCACEDMF